MQLSVVTTVYGSARRLGEFCDRVRAAAARLSLSYEIIVVRDGGGEAGLEATVGVTASDRYIRVLDLSRRYGHYEAILAGVRYATGDAVFVIDSDLDEPPELLETLWQTLAADRDCDLAVACQQRRRLRSIADAGGWLY